MKKLLLSNLKYLLSLVILTVGKDLDPRDTRREPIVTMQDTIIVRIRIIQGLLGLHMVNEW